MKKILISLVVMALIGANFASPAQAVAKPTKLDLEAKIIFDSGKDISKILGPQKLKRDSKLENKVLTQYVGYVVKDNRDMGNYGRSIVFFVAYGTPSTRRLSQGERAGVVDSFNNAFSRLPLTAGDWSDVLRISNGGKPATKSIQAEQAAKLTFRKVYGREPFNKGDEVAVYIMAYGIRPVKKDVIRERAAVTSFKKIYGFEPVYAEHWDVVRALAYSGVKK